MPPASFSVAPLPATLLTAFLTILPHCLNIEELYTRNDI